MGLNLNANCLEIRRNPNCDIIIISLILIKLIIIWVERESEKKKSIGYASQFSGSFREISLACYNPGNGNCSRRAPVRWIFTSNAQIAFIQNASTSALSQWMFHQQSAQLVKFNKDSVWNGSSQYFILIWAKPRFDHVL